MAQADIREAESVAYVAELLTESDGPLSWFTDATGAVDDMTGATAFAGPVDVYNSIDDSTVTWLWSVAPATTEHLLGMVEGLRALRHPDGWHVLIDAEDPEFLFVEHDVELCLSGHRTVVIDAGAVPTALTVGRLGESPFEMRSAMSPARITAAIELWMKALIGVEAGAAHVAADSSRLAGIAALGTGTDPDEAVEEELDEVDEVEFDGALVDADDIIGDRASVWWVQTELTWPDAGGNPCFPGSLQVHTRETDGSLAWLAEILPLDRDAPPADRGPVVRIDCDGWNILVPVDDPYTIFVPCDRLVLSAGRSYDTYESTGVGIPLGEPPPASAWDHLRAAVAALDQGLVHRTAGWSEERISESISAWLLAGTAKSVDFWYDADDPVSQQGAILNEDRANHRPVASERQRRRCMYRHPDALEFEVGARCPHPDEYHFRVGDEVVFVCSRHVPEGVPVTPVISR